MENDDLLKKLEYPFDADLILSKKRKIKKLLLEKNTGRIKKKIAILGGSTTNDIKLIMELFLLNYGIEPLFYESGYNQYYQEAFFQNSALIEFQPDIIYICTSNHNIFDYPTLEQTASEVDEMLKREFAKYKGMWERLKEVYHCPIVQNNFELPYYRLLGNKDASDIHGRVNYITRLNQEFYTYAQSNENFYICDINYISAEFGLKEWSDPFYWYMYKYAMNLSAIPSLSFNVANIIKSIFGKNKKGFVLDLDNTLWGGIVGDDGVENLKIGPEEPEGQAYLDFQKYLKAHKQLGVVLTINSKNDEKNALVGLNHPDGVLREDDFIIIKANWNSKDKNFMEIASQLNLLPESLVFVDDNPAERAIVSGKSSTVAVPEISEVQKYIAVLDGSGFFEVTNFTSDDMKRNQMYRENVTRMKMENTFENYEDYLNSLEMKAIIRPFESMYMARIAQLSNKSNQFNLTTKRYTQTQIEEVAVDSHYITLYGKLEDKFGDNGVVSVVIGHVIEKICHIDLWIMSCRALKRDLEYAMMDTLVEVCQKQEVEQIRGYYYPTEKNAMVKEFYGLQGFTKIGEDAIGNSIWEFEVTVDYKKKNKVIVVEK